MLALQLQDVLARLKECAEPKPPPGPAGHFDMCAEHKRNWMMIDERVEPRHALHRSWPVVYHQQPGIKRVPGEQKLRLAIIEREVRRLVTGNGYEVEEAPAEIDGGLALRPM